MKTISFLFFIFIPIASSAQTDSIQAVLGIRKFQDELNSEYKNPKESPLTPEEIKKFKAHSFYPINLKFQVLATLITTPNEVFFEMKTSTSATRKERRYGWVRFSIDGKEYQLPVYQSKILMETEKYRDYLFLPFTDLTSGEETYAGGRYLDLRIPAQGNLLTIDFNKAYNPYCAYSHRYSCPIVPEQNHLNVRIVAGTLAPLDSTNHK